MITPFHFPCLVLIAFAYLGPAAVAARSEDLKAKEIICHLDPKCPKLTSRSLAVEKRGVQVEGEVKEGPPSVDLYVNFAFNSAELLQDARITLDQLGEALRDPRLSAYSFKIAGHTDAKGTVEYNQALSERRAEAVAAYIVKNFGIAPARLSTTGYGKSRLLEPSRPEDGVNRRVQVINVGPEKN
jgi:outer membrane protein OmpA-like peptidoglycan-associated protein